MKLPNYEDERKRTDKKVDYVYLEDETYTDFLKGKKYYLKTYGCQMNVHDSEELAAHLENMGAIRTEELDESDIAILNTCAVRENAHDKVFGYLGRCKHIKDQRKDFMICICGCMAQEESVVDEIKSTVKS